MVSYAPPKDHAIGMRDIVGKRNRHGERDSGRHQGRQPDLAESDGELAEAHADAETDTDAERDEAECGGLSGGSSWR